MNKSTGLQQKSLPLAPQWPALLIWTAGWVLMLALDGTLALSSLAMLLVLTAAIASLWLRLAGSLLACVLAVSVFNWMFVPPRLTLAIDLRQDATLLVVMLAVSMLVTALMSSLRSHALQLQHQTTVITSLHDFSDSLRDVVQVLSCLPRLRQLLQEAILADTTVLALRSDLPADDDMRDTVLAGEADAAQLSGLWHCLRSGHPLGTGTGRYQGLSGLYLPLRGRSQHYGAVLLHVNNALAADVMAQVQALCDQMGAALERQHWQQQQQLYDQQAREQTLRATLLTAIAHDYRTPLATIMGAASTLEEQDNRLNQAQRQQLAHRIVEESARLRQLTTNILQLARLDAPGMALQCDWQTAEELAGTAVQHCRHSERVQLQIEAGLPLLWCDPLLVSQLLDNLLDNACKYATAATPIMLSVRNDSKDVVFAVQDNGPGIAPELQQLVFQPFRQGQALAFGVDAARQGGVGLGLALCRSVAMVHGGELRLRTSQQGCCFEFVLPHKPQPAHPMSDAA